MEKIKIKKGLTIIELLVTLALFSLLLILVYPKIDTHDIELLEQGKMLCNEIRNIRMLKMTKGGNYRILLEERGYTVLNGTIEIKEVDLKAGYKLLYSKSEISFNYDGTPRYGGQTIKILNQNTDRYYEITIVPASGRIIMKDTIY